MKKEKFFKELENKIRKANCMSDREKNSELKIIEELKNINSDNVDDYIDIINSFSIDDCYHFWEWLKTVTKYTEEDFQRYLSLNGQNDTDIAIKAIKGTLEIPHLTKEQREDLEKHLERMKTEPCEMTEEEWELTGLASIEKGFKKNEWYLTFLFNEENILNCRHCPYKNTTSNGCGQQHCWVKVNCKW